ncbi:MAG: 5-(carboxyamino)imidazole ribonucleotide mutase [Flexistipes sinusarabici]|uniref:N5-carboxyaminoimidazole ribonucleotide mutase n=1 Tax=Flexistipes sinusarabici TaxID=2352 RepID=A0A5D0MK23_FLESI|nr:5-(carboxyamino)imidazole ribonucleotide mutase [Flexistipes sinusarabici]TYB34027.1 MAG: 5-(carboxyamino)imidazole ribonucleotide mutase [Flexistipes sinusarabici]
MSKVGIIMGSKSDIEIAEKVMDTLDEFGVEWEVTVSSAHRTPEKTADWVKNAPSRGVKVIVAIAGAAAHLAGVVASETHIPVLAVPVASTSLQGMDALLSMVQMPGGVPVATMAIGKAGAKNAAIFSVQIISAGDEVLEKRLLDYKKDMAEKVYKDDEEIQRRVGDRG